MPLYTFQCRNGHRHDAFGAVRAPSRVCPECSCRARRVTVYRNAQVGRVRTPVAERAVKIREFTEASEQLAYEHGRAEESAQRPLPAPPLWQTAKRRAGRLMKAGINDSLDYRPDYIR